MKIEKIIEHLENLAPLYLQEGYDNSGLIVGSKATECTGILVCLDVTEKVVEEALTKKCNLIVSHHPIIFKGLKRLTGKNYVERTVISAIKNNIALYSIHTNLDNILDGVNRMMAAKLGLQNCKILLPKEGTLKKLVTFCPANHGEEIRDALFIAGAGAIGNYSECSFTTEGSGTFKAGAGSDPFIGKSGERHTENETRIEVVFPVDLQTKLIQTLKEVHPYEEVAYYINNLSNLREDIGSGLVGELSEEISEDDLLFRLKQEFSLSVIKHTSLLNQKVKKIALCGGAGFFLLQQAKATEAQVFITADIKYHEFFDADSSILLADIGHYESEQFTINLVVEFLMQKIPNFAVLKTEINTNPVNYYQ